MQCELNSTLVCAEVTGPIKEKMREFGGGEGSRSRVRGVTNDKRWEADLFLVKPI